MKYFKGDQTERKMYSVASPIIDQIELALDDFFSGCYETVPFGEILFDNNFSPLANAIDREIFSESFPEIFDAFVDAGTFESYLTVFRKIFGDDVEVEFTVPDPGKLNIAITAAGLEQSPWVAREIVDNEFEYNPLLTQAGDSLVFTSVKGFTSQYELEQMLFEMVPGGVYTEISLTIGA